MKKILNLLVSLVLFLFAAPMASQGATFFADYFTNSSTVNQAPVAPTTNSTSYQTAVGLVGATQSLSAGALNLTFPINSGVVGEVCALFTNTPIALAASNDFIALSITFINSSNVLGGADTANATLNVGLYNSGGVAPNQGHTVLNAGTATGGTEDWIGYIARVFLTPGNSSMLTRPAQTPNGTSSQNQDLLFSNASSSQAFNSPSGSAVGGNTAGGATLTNGNTYTMHMVITLTAVNTLSISNALYLGAGTGGTVLASQIKVASGATFLTSAFNGFAIGWRNTSVSQGSSMTLTAVEVTGFSSAVTGPPNIDTQPVSVKVANTGSCAFFVQASGFGMSYQWHRFGTNLVDGGNISGSTSDLLAISPAGAGDVASGANGYWVTITGTGSFSTNSTTNSLSLRVATNLVWNASAGVWDVDNTPNWTDPSLSQQVFNYGDPVTFDDNSPLKQVNLAGRYLGAASVTVDSTAFYNWVAASAGGFAGNGKLIYRGSGILQIGNANTYTGGTIISNPTARLFLNNYNGLGTGPVELALAGGSMQINQVGSTTLGLNAPMQVKDDFVINLETVGTFSGVFFGDISGTPGKVLTFNKSSTNTVVNQRVRFYAANMTYAADLLLNDAVISLAPYLGSGTQTYNGIISGPGGLIQRGNGTTILNSQNTYSGGTIPTTGTIAFGVDSIGTVTSGPIGTGPLYVAPEVANVTGSGTVLALNGARTIANPIQYQSGTNNQTLILGGTNAMTFTGPVTLQGNDGNLTFINRFFQVANTALTTFNGVVSDGGVGAGLIKTGAGILVLTAAETYTGQTSVSNGTLRVDGSLSTGPVLVAATGTLGGNGTVNGPVTVLTNGNLSAGASIGTLAIANSLNISGNVFVEVNRSVNPSNDLITVTGGLTNNGAGTITVSNLGPALVAGNSFKIFNKGVTNGNNFSITGGGAGVSWANNLALNGTISVAAVVTGPPVISSISLSGGNISISGTNGAAGGTYYVMATTDLLAPLSTWTPIQTNTFGAGGGFVATIPVSSTQPTRFYVVKIIVP